MIWVRQLIFVFGVGLSAVAGQAGGQVQELYGAARAAQSQGDVKGAIEKYEEILKIDPNLGPAYNNLGALYFRMGDFSNATAVLERGLKVNPAMPSAVALLGISLYETGAYDKARTRLEAALKANPKDDNVELFLAKDLSKLGKLGRCGASLTSTYNSSARKPRAVVPAGNFAFEVVRAGIGEDERH